MNKEEWVDLPKLDIFSDEFQNNKFNEEIALGLINELQKQWCGQCDNYKTNSCGCYFPKFKEQMIEKIHNHFNPRPYKFEELHKNMYVWVHWFKEDPTKGHPVKITGTGYDDNHNQTVYHVWNDSSGAYDFNAFIFYPLTKAMEYQGKAGDEK